MVEIQAQARAIVAERVAPALRATLVAVGESFPVYSEGARWVTSPGNRWCDGFWPGQLWLGWMLTGDKALRAAAEAATWRLKGRLQDRWANFDVGFLYLHSFAIGHRLTGDPALREEALEGAARLLDFFDPEAGALLFRGRAPEESAVPGAAVTIIDALMACGLLWWAAQESGEARFRTVALAQAETARLHQLRPSGAVWQQLDFDAADGRLICCGTRHGHSVSGVWARAQAWAVHGLFQAAATSGDVALAKAGGESLAFWQRSLGPEGLPPWDLGPSLPAESPDASAAAIVLAVLAKAPAWGLDLSGREAHWRALAQYVCKGPGLLAGGAAYPVRGEGLTGATVWGDYYLLEALAHLSGQAEGLDGFPL